jgi:hypothetical protein
MSLLRSAIAVPARAIVVDRGSVWSIDLARLALRRIPLAAAAAPSAPSVAVPRARHPRRWAIVGAALLLSGAAATWIALPDASPTHGVPRRPGVIVRPNSVAEFDDGAGAIVTDVPVGTSPGPVAVDGGYVWVADTAQHTVSAISETGTEPATTYGLPTAPSSLTPGPGVVWVSLGYDGRLARILIASNESTTPFFPDRPVRGLVAASARGTALWVATAGHVRGSGV